MNFYFTRSQDIEMSSEILDISEDQIRVDFVFRNLSRTGKTIDIAFPFAEHDYYDGGGATCSGEPRKAPDAKLSVNGKMVPFKWEYKFKLDGKLLPGSWTPLLLRVQPDPSGCGGGPEVWKATALAVKRDPKLLSTMDGGYKDFKQLTQLYRDEFKRADIEHLSDIRSQEFLTWRYEFPPGQDVKVSHAFSDDIVGFGNMDSGYEKDACLNQPPIDKIWKITEPKRDVCTRYLRYVLTSGAAWARPIGKFTLIVRKPEQSWVSTCFPDLRKISDQEFRAERSNFTPEQDLAVV